MYIYIYSIIYLLVHLLGSFGYRVPLRPQRTGRTFGTDEEPMSLHANTGKPHTALKIQVYLLRYGDVLSPLWCRWSSVG